MINEVCKSCGGTLNREGNYYVCKFCGNRWMIDADSDVHVIDRANAWMALRNCDFEKASEAFEYILEKEPNDHEAYWGRALSNAGIIYVTDLDENKKVPTCNNISEFSFIESYDVKKAIELAPKDIAASYKTQAERIEAIRVEWLKKASKEPDYDVFICFKDSDREHNLERTVDSYDAQDLYYALTSAGYNVFFSRVSLKDKVSEHYEPYIYNALKTAKVMIVFGEKPEYFNAVWVKNEWTRFRTRIENGEKDKNSLVVVYKGMNPAALPVGLRSRQCLNAGEITFLEDLKKHIEKIVRASQKKQQVQTPPPVVTTVPQNNTAVSTEAPKEISSDRSPKSWNATFFLCLFLGVFGIHRFYVGKITSGILYLLTFGFFGVGTFIDLLRIIFGGFTDKNKKRIKISRSGVVWLILFLIVAIFGVVFAISESMTSADYPDYDYNYDETLNYWGESGQVYIDPSELLHNWEYDVEIIDGVESGFIPEGTKLEVIQLYEDSEGYQLAYDALHNLTSYFYVYDINLYLDDAEIEPTGAVEVATYLRDVSESDLGIYYIDEEGNAVELDYYFRGDGRVGFVTDHFSYYVFATKWRGYARLELDPNGGDCYTSYVEIEHPMQEYELPIPTRDGYRFLGWYAYYGGGWNESYISVENSGRWELEQGDRTLTAMWEIDCNHELWDNGRITANGEKTYTCYGCGMTNVEYIEGGYVGDEVGYEYDAETETIYIFGNGEIYEYSLPGNFGEYANKVKNVVVYEGVTSMGNVLFSDFTALTSVTLPNTLRKLGGFRGCSALKSITIPEGVVSIEWGAFQNCTSLQEITIPESVEHIYNEAFYGCSSLTTVTIPEGVKYIHDNAFESCVELEVVNLPKSLCEGEIMYSAFAYCYDIRTVNFAGSEGDWKCLSIGGNNDTLLNADNIVFGDLSEEPEYVIMLDPNGGVCSEDKVVVKRGDRFRLPTPTREGYSFVGWFNGSEQVYSDTKWTGTEDLKLEAKWSLETYSIAYDYYDYNLSYPSTYTVKDIISIPNPTQEGYIFLGWTVSGEEGTEPQTDFVIKGRTGYLYLIAHWEKQY